eukprot:TRINITY_DN80592_c0_g3_i2.p1 TRINITY_DN80592_c0_g3~~TRINITY_DN80592_c0_g3_i2.p1  ORF type:complete len:216 (+),score=22.97 TRINITY_DN80592_c0_g3_i2:152-799(+)
MLEAVIGWEQNNIYDVFDQSGAGRFLAKEDTDCCTRVFFPACLQECREFKIDVSVIPMPGHNPPPFLHLERPCSCTFLCFNRPVMKLTDVTTGQDIGSVTNPWHCCDYNFSLKTPEQEKAIDIHATCCQPGILCPLPCGSCKEVNFHVKDHETKQEIGHLKRVMPGCLKACLTDADNYNIDFGSITDAKWKSMVLATALFIDLRYFSSQGNAPNL